MIEYRECLILYPPVPFEPARWTVNVASINWDLQAKLGVSGVMIDDEESLDSAIAKAKAFVDSLH